MRGAGAITGSPHGVREADRPGPISCTGMMPLATAPGNGWVCAIFAHTRSVLAIKLGRDSMRRRRISAKPHAGLRLVSCWYHAPR